MKMYDQLKFVSEIVELVKDEVKDCQVAYTVNHAENTYSISLYTQEHEYRMTADIPKDHNTKTICREVTEFLYGFTVMLFQDVYPDNGVVMTSLHKWFFGE